MAHAISSGETTNPTNLDIVTNWRTAQTASSSAAPPPSSAAPSGITSWFSSFFGGGGSAAASHKDLYEKVFRENDAKLLDYLIKDRTNPNSTLSPNQRETAIKELEGRQRLTESSTLPINSPSLKLMRNSEEVDRTTKEATEAAEKTSAAVASFVASGGGGGSAGGGGGGGGGGGVKKTRNPLQQAAFEIKKAQGKKLLAEINELEDKLKNYGGGMRLTPAQIEDRTRLQIRKEAAETKLKTLFPKLTLPK